MADCACDVTRDELRSDIRPSTFFLEITGLCHNACPGCGNVFSKSRSREALSTADWVRTLERIAPLEPRLRITGGEPTLHPGFREIIQKIEKLELPYCVFSNGRWEDPKDMVSFLSSLSHLEGLLISLHGSSPAIHEAFTATRGSSEETMANVCLAAQAGLCVHTSAVLTHHNCSDIEDLVRLGWGLGAQRVVFNRYVGPPMPALEASVDEMREAVLCIEGLIQEHGLARVGFGTPIPQCFAHNSSNGCGAGWLHLTIDPWGSVRPCPHMPLVVGSIVAGGTELEDLMSSPSLIAWQEGSLDRCGGCPDLTRCIGGCWALAEIRGTSRDPLVPQSWSPREVVLMPTCTVGETTVAIH